MATSPNSKRRAAAVVSQVSSGRSARNASSVPYSQARESAKSNSREPTCSTLPACSVPLDTRTAAGFEVSQLAIVLGALSLGIGLGLQAVINNFVSGLILMFERPIQPGDTVELAGTVGTVRDIGMRSTTFTTFEGADVVVPNIRRVDVPVGVAYGSDPVQVRDLLATVADRTERVARHPPPTVLFVGFGASSLDFSVRAWSHFDDYVTVRSALGLGIHAALKEAGIEIPFPQQDLHLKSIAPGLMQRLRPSPDGVDGPPAG
jgi:potassium-dependent mechanosensitive channel